MSDPRYEQRLSDPVGRHNDDAGSMWGWIAGVAVLVLIAIVLIAGWNSNSHMASNPLPAATTGSATAPIPRSPMAQTPSPATTGSAVQNPVTPANPAMPKPGTQ
jgi:hypothetical protein